MRSTSSRARSRIESRCRRSKRSGMLRLGLPPGLPLENDPVDAVHLDELHLHPLVRDSRERPRHRPRIEQLAGFQKRPAYPAIWSPAIWSLAIWGPAIGDVRRHLAPFRPRWTGLKVEPV